MKAVAIAVGLVLVLGAVSAAGDVFDVCGKSSNPCKNNAVCVDAKQSKLQTSLRVLCLCRGSWFGPQCDLKGSGPIDCEAKNPCVNGVCVSSSNREIACVCKEGFSGKLCDKSGSAQTGAPASSSVLPRKPQSSAPSKPPASKPSGPYRPNPLASASNPMAGEGGCRSSPCPSPYKCVGWDEWSYQCRDAAGNAVVPSTFADVVVNQDNRKLPGAGGCRSNPCGVVVACVGWNDWDYECVTKPVPFTTHPAPRPLRKLRRHSHSRPAALQIDTDSD